MVMKVCHGNTKVEKEFSCSALGLIKCFLIGGFWEEVKS